MAEKLTFLHAADLHLGAPLRGLRALSDKWADRVSAAIPAAFDALVDEALARSVDFVVIAGDIFDQASPSYADYQRFASGLARLGQAGIPVYLCTGNHDPYTTWRSDLADLPESATMFPADKPGFAVYERAGKPCALLGGRGFFNQVFDERDDIAAGITRAAAAEALGVEAPFAVGVVHTGLNLDPNKAPTDPALLLRSGMDYWALGHIHMPWMDDEGNPRIVFSGCIQGRDVKETGPRGCFAVTLEEGRPNRAEFVPLASVVWQLLDVDVSECQTVADVKAAVMKELFKANGAARCDEMVERIRLVGQTELHALLRDPAVLSDLRAEINASAPTFFCDSLRCATWAPWDVEALRSEALFPAALLSVAERQAADSQEALRYLQDEFLAHDLVLPAECAANIDGLLQSARNRALGLLGRGVA